MKAGVCATMSAMANEEQPSDFVTRSCVGGSPEKVIPGEENKQVSSQTR